LNRLEGKLAGDGLKVAIVTSRFNEFITDRLAEGAVQALVRHGVEEANITSVATPGCLEIPLVVKKLVDKGGHHAVIALGAVIRGATPHFEYVAAESAKGLASISLASGVPVINGILTTDSIEQAVERAGSKAGNKGASSAAAAVEMASLIDQIGS